MDGYQDPYMAVSINSIKTFIRKLPQTWGPLYAITYYHPNYGAPNGNPQQSPGNIRALLHISAPHAAPESLESLQGILPVHCSRASKGQRCEFMQTFCKT